MKFGCQSEVDQIKSLLLKHPKDAFVSLDNIQSQWFIPDFFPCPSESGSCDEASNSSTFQILNLRLWPVTFSLFLPENA